jgi:hypothetical protein
MSRTEKLSQNLPPHIIIKFKLFGPEIYNVLTENTERVAEICI